jgi:hypothetical protein
MRVSYVSRVSTATLVNKRPISTGHRQAGRDCAIQFRMCMLKPLRYGICSATETPLSSMPFSSASIWGPYLGILRCAGHGLSLVHSSLDEHFPCATFIDGLECSCQRGLIVAPLDAGNGAVAERLKLRRSRSECAQVAQRLIGC